MGSTYDPKTAPLVSPGMETKEWHRGFTNWLYRANQGKLMNTGTVTLEPGMFSTSVIDVRSTIQSFIDFQPDTANAGAELAGRQMYVSTLENGRFVITHKNSADSDRTFTYTIMG